MERYHLYPLNQHGLRRPETPRLWLAKTKLTDKAADPASCTSITCSDFRLSNFPYSYMRITGQGLSKTYSGVKPPFTEVSGNNRMKVFFHSRRKSKYAFSCIVAALGCGRRNPVSRIIRGKPTTLHEYPWQVALATPTDTEPCCGGSIISDQWILTAAHCFVICFPGTDPTGVTVVIGEHNWTTTTETSVTQEISITNHPT
ncbi:complement factor I-like [Macrobrachium nipponense]|uniref:complement factor I-like n=1 Tax=Macrobrachium nipponense TaxID=159736 RepID=UPI0030C7E6D7